MAPSVGDPRAGISIQLLIDAIDHIAQLTGNTEHVGLGADLDGGYGAESLPVEMDTVADLALIEKALTGRGFSTADVERILNGNWLRILRTSLP